MRECALALAALATLAGATAAEAGDGLSLRLAVDPAKATLGSPVALDVTLANETADKTFDCAPLELHVDSCYVKVGWLVPVPPPKPEPGKPPPTPPPPRQESFLVLRYKSGLPADWARPLPPGQKLSARIPLPMVRAGELTLQVIYQGCRAAPGGKIESAEVGVSVASPGRGVVGARVETTMGSFEVDLEPEKAPNTVINFLELAAAGKYDGTVVHRILEGAYIQGGDKTGDGTFGPGYAVPAELSDLRHVAGTISMARGSALHSAGCQFFVCLAPLPQYDNTAGFPCTGFGRVSKGMDVVKAIGKAPVEAWPVGRDFAGERSRATPPVEIKKVVPFAR
ncbi:MAG: peptidylprolyl isomerase [Planctomycetales bacterium]|nr:peptidylprolyl isomerase [Planctomycetales bacterium]